MSEKMGLGMAKYSQESKLEPVGSPRSLSFQILEHAFQRESAYLLPLRLFIGIGWLRAGLEKLTDSGWYNGEALAKFFREQLDVGLVVFPFYKWLIELVFEPNMVLLCWLVMLGEILVGLAILSGTFTNLALLAGIAMATNFILAGQVNPGAFYVVIQLVLFIANVGAILGVDYWLSKRITTTILVAQPKLQQIYHAIEKWFFLGLVGALTLAAIAVVPFIRDYSFSSVSDPAMMLFVLAMIAAFSFFIAHVRLQRSYGRRANDQQGVSTRDSFHIVFCPKFPLYLSSKAMRGYIKGLFYQIASGQKGVHIQALNVEADYVHMILEIAPKHDLPKIINYLKGKSAVQLIQAHPHLEQPLGVQLWSKGHYVSQTDLSEARIRRYVRSRRTKERDVEKKVLLSERQDSSPVF